MSSGHHRRALAQGGPRVRIPLAPPASRVRTVEGSRLPRTRARRLRAFCKHEPVDFLVHSLSRVDIGTMSAKRSHALIELRVRQAPEASHEAKRTSTNYRRHASPGRLKSSTSIVY